MNVRIYTKPLTFINESWNVRGEIDSAPRNDCYVDSLIKGKANDHLQDLSLLQNDFYRKIGIDIVAETVFDYPYPQITEKTIRPLINKRMFIIVGAPGILKFLHSQGFKTFHPFINEEYDTIVSPVKRLKFIFNEINRLCDLSIDEIQEGVLQYTCELNYNFDLLKNLEQQDLIFLNEKLSNI